MTRVGDDKVHFFAHSILARLKRIFQAIMLGGMTQDHSISDEGFCYVHTSRTWMRLVWKPGQAPSDLWNHTASLVHDKVLVVIGGKAMQHCRSVRLLDLVSSEWLHVPVSADIFGPRTLHAAVTVGASVLVHGGCVSSGSCSDELFSFDAATRCMKRLSPLGKRPCSRCRHSLNLVVSPAGDALVVCYGGSNDGQTLNDLWVLNCSSMAWRQVDVIGRHPALEGHSALTVKNRYVLFVGGYSRCKSGPSLLEWPGAGVLVFDTSTNAMSECGLFGSFPRRLIGHATSDCSHCLVVFGGMMPDGSGDSGGTCISSDITFEFERLPSSACSTRKEMRSPASMSSMDDDDFESESESGSQRSSDISGVADVNPGNLLSHASSMGELLHMEQQLQSTLQAISALREDGLISCIESKCTEFTLSLQRGHAAVENLVLWLSSVLTRTAGKPFDARLHVTLTLIKLMAGCGMTAAILQEVCSSYESSRLAAAAGFMYEMWAILQNADAIVRIRKLCAQEPGCFGFALHSLYSIRAFCAVLPEDHPVRKEALVCEHVLASLIGSLNGQSVAAPVACPLRIGFVADTHGACIDICRLIHTFAQRIVLKTPVQISSDHVQKIMVCCGSQSPDPSMIQAVTVQLQHPDLWQCNVRPYFLEKAGLTHDHISYKLLQLDIARVLGLAYRTGPGSASSFFPVPESEV